MYLEIDLHWLNGPRSALWPKRFELKPLVSPSTEQVFTFRILIDGVQVEQGCQTRDFSLIDETGFDTYWPWIFGLCCLMGDIHPQFAETRLVLIRQAIYDAKCPHSYLEKYSIPSMGNKLEMDFTSLDEWMHIMYPVTGRVRSRFHTPDDFVHKRYGHLLN